MIASDEYRAGRGRVHPRTYGCMREQTAARSWCFTATYSTVCRAGRACKAAVQARTDGGTKLVFHSDILHRLSCGACVQGSSAGDWRGSSAGDWRGAVSARRGCAPGGPCRTRSPSEPHHRRSRPRPGRRPRPCCWSACCRHPSRRRQRGSQHVHHCERPSSGAGGKRSSAGSICCCSAPLPACYRAAALQRRHAIASRRGSPVALFEGCRRARRRGGQAEGTFIWLFSQYGWFFLLSRARTEYVYKSTPP